ncbi:MAG: phage/plasmid replication protein, II/X family [Motiliproteus sp.]
MNAPLSFLQANEILLARAEKFSAPREFIRTERSFTDKNGLIDWLSLRLDMQHLTRATVDKLRSGRGKIMKISPNGDVEWETFARENIRSDSHQITINVGSHFEIQGSPARLGQSHNVFGSLDIKDCARAMIDFAAQSLGLNLAPSLFLPRRLPLWRCTRIDVTRNYAMPSIDEVLQALQYLKHVGSARQKASSHDTTVSWGQGSGLHSGKAYAKGPQALKQQKKGTSFYTDSELELAQRLLRLEYMMRGTQIDRIFDQSGMRWYDYSPEYLLSLHDHYFSPFISDIEVTDMGDILELLIEVSKNDENVTEGRARAAYDCYTRIRMMGPVMAKASYRSSNTWFKHKTTLRKAGLSEADLQATNVIPLKKRQIVLSEAIGSWDDIRLSC